MFRTYLNNVKNPCYAQIRTEHRSDERGLRAYASQFHIPTDHVPAWFAGTVGELFGEEAIQSAANAWSDDELSLRDRGYAGRELRRAMPISARVPTDEVTQ